MADPFTIIGTTSAVISFAQFAGKIISTAYSLYDSTTNSTAQNDRLEDVTSKMNQLLDTLGAQKTAKPQSSQDKSIAELAANCHSLGDKILKLLKETKAKKTHSVRESIRAAMATVWTKNKVENLRRDLDRCINQLTLHLQTIIGSETSQTLQIIMDSNFSNAKDLSSLQELLNSIKKGQELEIESLTEIRDIFSRSKSNLELINQNRILKGLEFQDMESRFVEVSKAARETFEWCVHDSEVPESSPDLKMSFREWLRGGNGVFHISGKPGAGKSTLMKFIADHNETKTQLKEWAGTRTLVVANFFFWKPGKPLQKSLEGLIRSLVHSILSKIPDLISTVFPQFWDPGKMFLWQPQTELKIPYETIRSAFKILVESSGYMQNYCFCFFIDGLDEFDDPEEHHAMLASRLQRWTESNPEGLKICVSSREENAFLDQFSPQQRLQLHLVTEGDMKKMTTNFLEKHPRFLRSTTKDREELIDTIVSQAQGVFLWVKLVLNEICDSLDELLPHQSLQGLQRVLESIPEDLEKFFTYILGSISKRNRHESWTVFALVMATNNLASDECPSLIHYSFVREFFENKRFGIEKPMRDATMPEIKERVDAFKKRLRGLCRGLVELRDYYHEHKVPSYYTKHPDYWGLNDSIVFTHRSVYEFLQQEPRKDMKEFFDTLDVNSVLLQCIIAQVKFLPFSKTVRERAGKIAHYYAKNHQKLNFVDKHLEQLGSLDDVLLYREHASSIVKEIDWPLFTHFDNGQLFGYGEIISLLGYSCRYGFQNYVAWSMENRPNLLLDSLTRARLLDFTMNGLLKIEPPPSVHLLQYLLQQGFSPELNSGYSVWTVWETYIGMLTSYQELGGYTSHPSIWWEVMKVFLDYDADPHFCFRATGWYNESEEENFTKFSVNKGLPPDVKHINWEFSDRDGTPAMCSALSYTKSEEISLREFVEFCRPDDVELLGLIDRKLAIHKERARLAIALQLNVPMELADTVAETEVTEAENSEEARLRWIGPDEKTALFAGFIMVKRTAV
ncbi:hypothetical protein N431DRAFT_563443 [Stipitochalara longipes BDJ]|nr:hypothetical protein N431DRAFT_563443 [Stipitochalara longipes BDJ]